MTGLEEAARRYVTARIAMESGERYGVTRFNKAVADLQRAAWLEFGPENVETPNE